LSRVQTVIAADQWNGTHWAIGQGILESAVRYVTHRDALRAAEETVGATQVCNLPSPCRPAGERFALTRFDGERIWRANESNADAASAIVVDGRLVLTITAFPPNAGTRQLLTGAGVLRAAIRRLVRADRRR
jgi:hypothetical protein